MSRLKCCTLAAAVLALAATAAAAQTHPLTTGPYGIYPLTNGPDGKGPNTVDSAKGFVGANAVATERECIYHPELCRGNTAESIAADLRANGVAESPGAAPTQRRARRHGRRDALR